MCSAPDFTIADCTPGDADVNKGIFGKLKTLGMIVVKWHRGRVVPYRRRLAPPPFAGASLAGGRVPEKNLKGQAITHQTTYAIPKCLRSDPN